MIKAKTAPHISLIRETLVERAFKDLESQVSDIKHMSIIAELAVEHSWHGNKSEDNSEAIDLHLTRDEFNSMHFAVMHLGDMIRKFHDDYFECFTADKGGQTDGN